MKNTEHRCCKQVRIKEGMYFMRYKQCSRKGVIERDGKHYCRQHDPAMVEKRRNEWTAKMNLENESRRKEFNLRQAAPEMKKTLIEAKYQLVIMQCNYKPSQVPYIEASAVISKIETILEKLE